MYSSRARPTFAISTTSSPLMRAGDYIRAADNAAAARIDLDLTVSRLRRRMLKSEAWAGSDAIVCIRLPAAGDIGALLDLSGWQRWSGTIVVHEDDNEKHNGRVQLAKAIRLRESAGANTRIALGVRPRNPDGGRAHLTALSFLRSVAEEWDLDLALDLSGPADWLWEAEAAVLRMIPRLSIVRLIYPLPALDTHVRGRLSQRTLAACLDSGFSGLLSIVAPLPLWRWRDQHALVEATRTAVARLGSRYALSVEHHGVNAPERSSTP